MPCHDGTDALVEEERKAENVRLKTRNDLLARIACKAMSALESIQDTENIAAIDDIIRSVVKDPEVKEWWEKHKQFDQQRKGE